MVGIAGHTDDMKAVGRLALRSIIYFEIVTTLALFIGLGAVNFIKPGEGVQLTASKETGERLAATKVTFDGVVNAPPKASSTQRRGTTSCRLLFFAILFGVTLSLKGKPRQTMLDFFEGMSEVMFKFTGFVMWVAPSVSAPPLRYTIAEWPEHSPEPWQTGSHSLRRAPGFHSRRVGAGHADLPNPGP